MINTTGSRAGGTAHNGEQSVIDVHSHPSIAPYRKMVRDIDTLGPEQRFSHRTFFPPGLPEWTPEWALEVMERERIGAQVLSLPDATVGLRGDLARRTAREINEAMADIVARHPERFAAFAVLPHDDTDATLAEIEYALDVLKLDGVCTTTHIRGSYLGDPAFDPWLAELHRRSAVLFVHPTLAVAADPKAPLYIEFCFDSTRMVINMVLSGAKRRFDGIKLISTHGGGTIPYISHRLETIEPLLGGGKLTSEGIAADLRSFYYDLTSCMAAVPLAAASRFADPSKLLLGFDFPYAPASFIAPEIDRFFAFDGLGQREKTMIAQDNALALFPRLASARRAPGGPR
ncbi:MAG: amidohydrolase family protein [Pseudomonadota bacterium]